MPMLDLDAFDRTPLKHDPCDFLVVPRFVKPEALAAINRDYQAIAEPGNFEPEQFTYGPAFTELLAALRDPELKRRFGAKFGLDLSEFPLQLTVRKFSEATDGNVHNDSKSKIVTVLIYFNEVWPHAGGRLRLMRSPKSLDDYQAEVEPSGGTMLAFHRSETSYHGFYPVEAERRSLQMYWVKPKREQRTGKVIGLKRLFKRWRKERAR
jgi:SM-20-related protein